MFAISTRRIVSLVGLPLAASGLLVPVLAWADDAGRVRVEFVHYTSYGAAALVLLLSLLWHSVRLRQVQMQQRRELKSAVERERRRIARDIHDELGVHLAQVMLFSQTEEEPGGMNGRHLVLSKIHTKTMEITKALDGVVWAVNPSHDSVEDFALYVAHLGQDMASAAGMRCRIMIPETLPPTFLGSGSRHHLLMCVKEALANAIKHSACTQIDLHLEIDRNWLRLVIADDGRGFVVPSPGSQELENIDHSGCRNMRARMGELNGRFDMESVPGRGTRVTFEYPL